MSHKKQIERIKAVRDKWHRNLGMLHWEMTHTYTAGQFRKLDTGKKSGLAAAAMTADWRYCHATCQWNTKRIAALSDDDLEYVFVHEMMHAHLAELRMRPEMDHEERVATGLARAFLWVAEGSHAARR